MKRFNAVVLASVLLLGGLVGCNQEEPNEAVLTTPIPPPNRPKRPRPAAPNATATASPAASPATSPGTSPGTTPVATPAGNPTASPAKANTPVAPANTGNTKTPPPARVKQAFTKLNGYLPAAVKELQANDIATAKKYAQDFNANWLQLQNLVKTASQPSHQKISAAMTQVTNNLIKPATPDKAKAISSLQSLSQAVTEYAKSP